MSFVVDAGVVVIKDGSTEILNTGTDELLHYLTPRVDGTVNRPAVDWSGSGVPTVRTYDAQIATLPEVSTDIVGLVRFRYSTGYTYLPPDAWFCAGGTHVLVHKFFQSISGTWGNYPRSIGLATIYKNGTALRFKEHFVLEDHYMAGPNLNLAAFSVDYRIYPAAFS
jgi:hypothetical protein